MKRLIASCAALAALLLGGAGAAHASAHKWCADITVKPGNVAYAVLANKTTSCEFAEVVGQTWLEASWNSGSPLDYVSASSPVTKRSYTLRCHTDGPATLCRSGTALVRIVEN